MENFKIESRYLKLCNEFGDIYLFIIYYYYLFNVDVCYIQIKYKKPTKYNHI